ncbi:long-chain-fatty-acid--AMP ligase FadD30 [mine drainage metagenome]|uniref:Long-chain-fatty-acid--AMP ligase FadD30 n=1 Tax=mine drainage metagenome TaxID=410659 RepID=A0A1J5T020_9ZZZZ
MPDIAADQAAVRMLEIVRQLLRETHPGLSFAVSVDSSFERDLQLDSMARVELLLRVGQAFAVTLPEAALAEAETPRDLLRCLGHALAPVLPSAPTALVPERQLAPPAAAMTLVEALEWHAARQPTRVHVLLLGEDGREDAVSYGTLLEAAQRSAAGLRRRGLQTGQTVALMLPTGRAYLECFFAVLIAGGIPVPIYPPARLAQIEDHLRRHGRILANAEAALMITVKQAKPVAAVLSLATILTPEELSEPGPSTAFYRARAEDIALLQYTSGSTGDPKGVVLSHANLLANIRAMGRAAGIGGQDVFVSWLPLYHDMGLIGAWLGSLYHGIPLVLMSPLSFLARPARWLTALSRHRGTVSAGPNFAFELCLKKIADEDLQGVDLSAWRLAFNGAETVSPATLEAFARRFAACGLRREAIAPVYGLAECSVGLAFPPLERGPLIDRIRREPFAREGRALPAAASESDALSIPSCGRPLPGHEIRILDGAGLELPERRVGRLEFRGPSATSGYYRNAEATARLKRDGWLDSGDLAYMAAGEVYIAGRVKDLIIRGGRNIYPYDLEQAVGNLPGVRRGCVAVFAATDALGGTERLVVLAETRERALQASPELRRRINEAAIDVIGMPADDIVLAPPHAVLKTSSGKIRRAACRAAYERGELGREILPVRVQAARLVLISAAARAAFALRRAAIWGYAGYFWALFALLAPLAGGLAALLRRPILGRRIAHFAAAGFLHLAFLPLTVKGRGALPSRPHMLLVNHASYLDVILLAAVLAPTYSFVAKRELLARPVLRAVLQGLGVIFVERFEARQSAQDVAAMAAALQAGQSLMLFPEGTFTREAGLRPFATGGFVAACRAGVPVVVCGLRGTRAALRDESWLPRRAAIEFEVGPTLAPAGEGWAAALALSQAARSAMLPLCGEHDRAA